MALFDGANWLFAASSLALDTKTFDFKFGTLSYFDAAQSLHPLTESSEVVAVSEVAGLAANSGTAIYTDLGVFASDFTVAGALV